MTFEQIWAQPKRGKQANVELVHKTVPPSRPTSRITYDGHLPVVLALLWLWGQCDLTC